MSLQVMGVDPPRTKLGLLAALAMLLGLLAGLAVGRTDSIFLPAAIVFGVLVALITVLNLEFGLLIFTVITYLRISDIAVHNYNAPSIARLYIALLILSLILRWAITREMPKGWLMPAVLILAYGLVIFGSILYASDFASAQGAAGNYWKDGLISILVVLLLQRKGTFRYLIWALILSGLFLGSISVYQYLSGTFDNPYFGFAEAPLQNIVGETEGNRVSGPIGDPNFYAQILVVLVPLAINRMIAEKSLVLKGISAISVLVITLSIFYTFSRGGVIALVVALIALAFYKPPPLKVILVVLILAVVAFSFTPSTFKSRMGTITGVLSGEQDTRSEVSFRGRASEMLSAWYMFLDHPILGVGADNYPVNYQSYARRLGLDNRATIREPHNLFLQVAAETGILGILVFGLILYALFRSLAVARNGFKKLGDLPTYDLISAFSASLVGYLAAAMFIHGAYPRYFWLLAGIAFALPQVLRNEKMAKEENFAEPK